MRAKNTDEVAEASIEVDVRIYPLLSLQKAAYEFSGRASIGFETKAETRILLTLAVPAGDARQVLESFKARVADLALQEKINEQTQTIRDALVSAAMWESLPHKAR